MEEKKLCHFCILARRLIIDVQWGKEIHPAVGSTLILNLGEWTHRVDVTAHLILPVVFISEKNRTSEMDPVIFSNHHTKDHYSNKNKPTWPSSFSI